MAVTDDNGNPFSDLIKEAWARGEPSGWFETLYANAEKGDAKIPWAMMKPHPHLTAWVNKTKLDGTGLRALVTGCGLGDDAELLREVGFAVTAFDISETAIKGCKERFPDSSVDYQVIDLFKTPDAWQGHFDLVLDSRTIQSMPYQYHQQAIEVISACVADNGRVLVLCFGRDDPEAKAKGIPWGLSRKELAHFEACGLQEDSWEDINTDDRLRLRVVYRKT